MGTKDNLIKDEESPSAGSQAGTVEDDEEDGESSIIPIVIVLCVIIIVGGLGAVFGLHYKRKLPSCFYRIFSPRWKPVMSSDDYPETEEEDKEKRPSIIKNNGDLNVSELGDGANINNDLTTVTWTSDEKEVDEEKKEKKEEEQKETEKAEEDTKEKEKLVDEKEVEKKDEKNDSEKEEKITEDTPLQKKESDE